MSRSERELVRRLRAHQQRCDEVGSAMVDRLDLRAFQISNLRLTTDYLGKADLSGSTFQGSLLSRAFAADSRWVRGGAADSSFYKTDFSRSTLEQLQFSGCDFVRTDMSSCELRDVAFVDCSFIKTLFSEALLERVTFLECDFERPYFAGAVLMETTAHSPRVGRLVQASEPKSGPEFFDALRAAETGVANGRPLLDLDL